ncbi:MAG: hypothetical protein RL660_2818 [Bacteroidota bacterium]|jgi:hypothetical protein
MQKLITMCCIVLCCAQATYAQTQSQPTDSRLKTKSGFSSVLNKKKIPLKSTMAVGYNVADLAFGKVTGGFVICPKERLQLDAHVSIGIPASSANSPFIDFGSAFFRVDFRRSIFDFQPGIHYRSLALGTTGSFIGLVPRVSMHRVEYTGLKNTMTTASLNLVYGYRVLAAGKLGMDFRTGSGAGYQKFGKTNNPQDRYDGTGAFVLDFFINGTFFYLIN